MTRDDVILLALAAGGQKAIFTPVQVQKLLFLVDREAAPLVGGPHFKFKPYDFGPFDRGVYDRLQHLADLGLVEIRQDGKYRNFGLSDLGYRRGSQLLQSVAVAGRQYLNDIALWVQKLSFDQLVAAIYNRYPDMKVRSIFRG